MSNINLQFDRPWMFFVLIPVLALILVPFFLLPANRRKNFKKIAPVVLHCVIATILIIILAGTNIVTTSKDQQVVILMDLSDSTKDYHTEIVEKAEKIKTLIGDEAITGVVAFAGDAVYAVELGEKSKVRITEVEADATDIASALVYADSLMSGDTASRIILISDGRQTEGDAASVAYFLCGHRTRIDSMYFDTTELDTVEMQISSVTCSENDFSGETVTIKTEIKSNAQSDATINIYDNNVLIEKREVTVNKDLTVYFFDVNPETTGVHSFKVELEPEADSIAENNAAYAYTNISDQPSILIICSKIAESELLADLLEENSKVKTVTAQNAPNDIVKLCNYDEIILMNVDNTSLPEGMDGLLKQYVEEYGGTLLAAGGTKTFSFGNMEDTLIEEVLPVDFEFTEASEGASVAIMLVVDCSSSMSSNNYWTIAKQGAIKCVEALTENDYVGVISFSSTASVNQELVQATEANKTAVTRVISGLKTARGTQYSKALSLAYNELVNAEADIKYVMFLSDGEPQDNYYSSYVKKLNNSEITVSTIAIGYESSVLSNMASNGGGRYYAVKKVADLPDIMLSETEQVAATNYISGDTRVCVSNPSYITENIDADSLPTIRGYVGVTAKDDAKIYLTSEEGNIIYAEWSYGNGTAAVFTSDLASWCSDWFADEAGMSVIRGITSLDNKSNHKSSTMGIECKADGGKVKVTISSDTATNDNYVQLAVRSNSLSTTMTLNRNVDGLYEGSFNASELGVYYLSAKLVNSEGYVCDTADAAYVLSYSEEYNAFGEAGKSLLESIVSYSGGRVTSDVTYLAGVKMQNAVTCTNPMFPLAIVALILFLADVAIRKIRWKDLIAVFRK